MSADIRVGDVVHVRGTILQSDFDGRLWFTAGGVCGWVRPSTIVHVEPRPLAVGDKVVYSDGYGSGLAKIVTIVGDKAWVQTVSDLDVVRPVVNLRRVP